MLMTDIELTRVQRAMLKVLCENPDQRMTRSDIATGIGKEELATYHARILHDMQDAGFIHIHEDERGFMTYYEYSATPAGCAAIDNE